MRCIERYEQSHEGRQVQSGRDIAAQYMDRPAFANEVEMDIDTVLRELSAGRRKSSRKETLDRVMEEIRARVLLRARIPTVDETLIDYFTKLHEKTGDDAYGVTVVCIQHYEQAHEGRQVQRGSDIAAQLVGRRRPKLADEVEEDISWILGELAQVKKLSRKETLDRVMEETRARVVLCGRIPTVNETLIDYFTKLSEKTGNDAYGGVVVRIQHYEQSHEGRQVQSGRDIAAQYMDTLADISAQYMDMLAFANEVEMEIDTVLQAISVKGGIPAVSVTKNRSHLTACT